MHNIIKTSFMTSHVMVFEPNFGFISINYFTYENNLKIEYSINYLTFIDNHKVWKFENKNEHIINYCNLHI